MHSPHRPDRRAWMRVAAALAPGLWVPRSAVAQPRLAADPFGLGVASGTPSAHGVVLWTRLHDAGWLGSRLPSTAITVNWELAEDDRFQRVVRKGQAQAVPQLDHSVHVEVDGLEADRWYHYRFSVGGLRNDWQSPVGRTRTLPAADARVARWRLAYASCQRWEHGFYAAWRHLVADAPDLVLFLGDYIYEYPGAAGAVRLSGTGWVSTLEQYRARYALHRSDADLRAAHACAPWFVIWDDHEVQNDYAGASPGDSGPAVADFAQRRAWAYQAYYENMPLPAQALTDGVAGLGARAELRLYRSAPLGRLGRLHLLDTRQYRDAQACARDGAPGSATVDPAECAAWADPRRQLLGAAQERWLLDGLHDAQGPWQVVAQQTLFGRRVSRGMLGRQTFWNDGWDGYSPVRDRLVAAMAATRARTLPVLLGGDIHENWVGHVLEDYEDPRSRAVGVEFCGTSISSRANGAPRVAARLAANPHFVFADGDRRGYGLVDLSPERLRTRLRVVDDVTLRDAGVATLAEFEVRAGKPRIERV